MKLLSYGITFSPILGHSNALILHQAVWDSRASPHEFLKVTSMDKRGGPTFVWHFVTCSS